VCCKDLEKRNFENLFFWFTLPLSGPKTRGGEREKVVHGSEGEGLQLILLSFQELKRVHLSEIKEVT
jgi:hypothetical protein